jgi:hypothetical protein
MQKYLNSLPSFEKSSSGAISRIIENDIKYGYFIIYMYADFRSRTVF